MSLARRYFSPITSGLALTAMLLISGCSTVMEGRTQKITVNSTPAGADCVLKQADDVVGRITTPGSTLVSKTKNDLVILCSKPGYETISVNNHSDMALLSLGNMVLGQYSFIGNAVDSVSGANNKYDSRVFVTLLPAETPTAFPSPPGAQPTVKLAPQMAAAMSVQAPMPAAALKPELAADPRPDLEISATKAIAAPVTPVATNELFVPGPSISASEQLAKAARNVPSPMEVAQRDYVQALAESPPPPAV